MPVVGAGGGFCGDRSTRGLAGRAVEGDWSEELVVVDGAMTSIFWVVHQQGLHFVWDINRGAP